MTEQIQSSLHTCNRLNEQLERTVESRTDELKRKNQQLQETLRHLKRTQAQLITQEKLASLGELTAGIAHELKNPLNFVSNFNQLIFSEVKDIEQELAKEHPNQKKLWHMFEDLPELTRRIRKNTDRAVRIIDGMLKHARGGEGMHIPTQINALVKEYVAFAYHGMRRFNMTIEEEYDPVLDSDPISIVPQDISRAILNIALNACYELNRKHHTMNNEYIPILQVSTEDAGSDVIIRIRDNGGGIPEEIREKIFQPFFSTKPAGEGTGLGLSIAYDIITNMHQGRLDVTSQIGDFTEFVIRLPKSVTSNQ
jgi:signal transduction histidine kinase